MKFEEIFKEEGMYKAESFTKGFALHVCKNTLTGENEISYAIYERKSQPFPTYYPVQVYAGLFKKDYTKVLTKFELFD